ncbi:glycosyltransferase, partial [Thermodesulfobacteriota bacterium]
KKEFIEGIQVYHPRYPIIPRVSMPFHGLSLFMSTKKLVKKIYQEFPFDIIDGHYIYPDGFAAVLLGKALRKPVVLSARGSDIHQFAGFKLIKPLIQYSLNSADHVISVCDALKQEIVHLGTSEQKIAVVPNGVDINRFYPEDREKARKRLSLANHEKIILSVGLIRPLKGFHIIIEALRDILPKEGGIHFYIVGDGPYRGALNNQIKRLNLGHYVTLVGERPNSELKTWYSAADVFCLASSREGWANVIMESLACGTPVVATNVWGAPEILNSPAVGILVERDPKLISEALIKALHTRWDRVRIQQHAAARTWNAVAREVQTVFDPLLNRG